MTSLLIFASGVLFGALGLVGWSLLQIGREDICSDCGDPMDDGHKGCWFGS